MKIGTKSVLFGAHCFFIHPFIVAISWIKLYGFKSVLCPHTDVETSIFDWKLWACFFFHDLGYIGKPNMDGPEGEEHPLLGAEILYKLTGNKRWYNFCLRHSRFYSNKWNSEPSLFCWADKMAIALTPSWIYVPLTKLTGELEEYMHVNPREIDGDGKNPIEWHNGCKTYCYRLAMDHKNGQIDYSTKTFIYSKEM